MREKSLPKIDTETTHLTMIFVILILGQAGGLEVPCLHITFSQNMSLGFADYPASRLPIHLLNKIPEFLKRPRVGISRVLS